jgi:hypothetical protein
MAQYKLYTGGPYKQNNGSAITATSTDITVGAAKNVKDSEILNRSENSTQEHGVPNVNGGVAGVGPADLTAGAEQISSVSESTEGLAQLNFTGNHGLSAGSLLVLVDETFGAGAYRVVRTTSGTGLVVNKAYNATIGALVDLLYYTLKGSLGVNTVENFIMKKNDATVHGQANSTLSSGAADYGRDKVHKTNAVRTTRTATAIRNNKWNVVEGQFTTAPTTANDFSGMDTDGSDVPDNEAKAIGGNREVGGGFTIKHGGPPQTKDYEHKTE